MKHVAEYLISQANELVELAEQNKRITMNLIENPNKLSLIAQGILEGKIKPYKKETVRSAS